MNPFNKGTRRKASIGDIVEFAFVPISCGGLLVTIDHATAKIAVEPTDLLMTKALLCVALAASLVVLVAMVANALVARRSERPSSDATAPFLDV